MTHITEGVLQACLDDELPAEHRSRVERHLADCEECRARSNHLERVAAAFSRELQALDLQAPALNGPRPMPQRMGTRWWGSHLAGAPMTFLRAALIVLLLGGVAWGALPGTALRGWVTQLWRAGPELQTDSEAFASGAGAETAGGQLISGVSILPVDGEARVVIRDQAEGMKLLIRTVAGAQVTVQWTGAGTDPRFRTATGRVEVVGGDSGEILIEAPRGSRTLVEVSNQLIAIVEGGLVQPLIAAERSGDDVIFNDLESGG